MTVDVRVRSGVRETMAAMALNPMPTADQPPWTVPARSLGALVARLQPAGVEVACAPGGLDVNVGDPVIFDPADEVTPAVASIVLGVGVDTDDERVLLLQATAQAGAAALVLKAVEPFPAQLVEAATGAGVALLRAPFALSWGQLYTLLLTATPPEPAEGRAGVPLGDLFALANAVAAMVGGATTIEDPQNHVLAYSNLDHAIDVPRQQTILGRQVPSDWIDRLQEAGVFRQLWQSPDVVRIDEHLAGDAECLARIAVSVRAGGELIGSIWVIEGNRPLGADAERTLREAADIAALHLLRHRDSADVDRRRRAEALLGILDGIDRGERARQVLRLSGSQSMAVIAFDARVLDEPDAVVSAQRVADLVAVYSESYRRHAACTASGSRAYALVPVDPGRGQDAVTALARAVVERSAQALRIAVVAGIGSTVDNLEDVAASRREADQVVDVLAAGGRAAVATLAEVHAHVVIDRLRVLAGQYPDLAAGPLQALAEQDAAKGTSWVPTLRAYFDAFGDMAVAARQVNVHPNTFRYRLRRIVELFGLELDDPDARLVAELQLRFLDITGGSSVRLS